MFQCAALLQKLLGLWCGLYVLVELGRGLHRYFDRHPGFLPHIVYPDGPGKLDDAGTHTSPPLTGARDTSPGAVPKTAAVAMKGMIPAPTSKLLLHLGPYVTETTFFQDAMSTCSKAGLYRGWSGLKGHAHLYLGPLLGKSNLPNWWPVTKRKELVKAFAGWIQGGGNKVISDEFLCVAAPHVSSSLAKLLVGYDVTVVWVKRNYFSSFLAEYKTSVRTGSIAAVTMRELNKEQNMGALSCGAPPKRRLRNFDGFVEAFGHGNVRVLDYDGMEAEGVALEDAIVALAGMPPLPPACRTSAKRYVDETVDVDSLVLEAVFDRYLTHRGCKFKYPPPHQKLEHLLSVKWPRMCSRLDHCVSSCEEGDVEMQEKFRDIIWFANLAAARAAVQKALPVCELDTERIWAEHQEDLAKQLEEAMPSLQC